MMNQADVLGDLDQLASRYDVLRQMGHDGEYGVHAVRSRASNRHFAVKVMNDPGSRDARKGALYIWQAHTIRPLDHPHLTVLHAVHHLQGGAVAIAMERRRGCTLAERIEQTGPLPIHEVERVLRDVGGALAYVHGHRAVHRGVRPHSIFLDRDSGEARLAPFGLDRGHGDSDPSDGGAATLRAFSYLAPEQIAGREQVEGRQLGPCTDLYGLGLAGYAMLTGVQPWAGTDLDDLLARRDTEPLPPLRALRPDAPAYLCDAIEGCLEPDPRRRWRSADAFLACLDPSTPSPTPALDLTGIGLRVADAVAAARSAAGDRLTLVTRRRLALALPPTAVALVALIVMPGRDGAPPASPDGSAAEIVAPADRTPDAGMADPPGIIGQRPVGPTARRGDTDPAATSSTTAPIDRSPAGPAEDVLAGPPADAMRQTDAPMARAAPQQAAGSGSSPRESRPTGGAPVIAPNVVLLGEPLETDVRARPAP